MNLSGEPRKTGWEKFGFSIENLRAELASDLPRAVLRTPVNDHDLTIFTDRLIRCPRSESTSQCMSRNVSVSGSSELAGLLHDPAHVGKPLRFILSNLG